MKLKIFLLSLLILGVALLRPTLHPGRVFAQITNPSSAGGGVWGSITGTLSSQTDLQTALNLLAPIASPVFTGFPRSGSTVRVASNFTTSGVGTALENITGLSWTLPNTGTLTFSFACDGTYSIANGTAAVAFGIRAATANPTNIYATGIQQITGGPPATYVSGTLATLATTTATNITSGTPGGAGSNNTFQIAGTIENPATTANTFNIMVSTATAADTVTVLRGSMCYFTP